MLLFPCYYSTRRGRAVLCLLCGVPPFPITCSSISTHDHFYSVLGGLVYNPLVSSQSHQTHLLLVYIYIYNHHSFSGTFAWGQCACMEKRKGMACTAFALHCLLPAGAGMRQGDKDWNLFQLPPSNN